MKRLAAIAGFCATALALIAALLTGWLLFAGGAPRDTGCAGAALDDRAVPARLVPLFQQAAATYGLGPEGAAVLAALTKVESDFGRDMGPSSAGATGWTQFMPATWAQFGVDANGDGTRDPMDPADAIASAANYLRFLGAPGDWHRALFGYNQAGWYVDRVLAQARALSLPTVVDTIDLGCSSGALPTTAVGHRVFGGGQIVPIPGSPGESIDARLLPDIEFLQRQFHLTITAAYAPTGHDPGGEHPLGLAIDVVPGPGGTWDDIDALAQWAEPIQNEPRPPFRWVGYSGDPGHGRGDHLHLSWQHGRAPGDHPPAAWVRVLITPQAP